MSANSSDSEKMGESLLVRAVFYGVLIFGSLVAAALLKLQEPSRAISGVAFVEQTLFGALAFAAMPLVVAVIAGRFKGINKIAFLIAWPICVYLAYRGGMK